jgi:transposase
MPRPGRFELERQRLGPLPIVNHFLARLGLEATLERFVPTGGRPSVSYAKGLGILLRSIIVEREPIYRQQELVRGFWPPLFGISHGEVSRLSDDKIGRALERLFDADRASLLTEVVVHMRREFSVSFDELHNDSTTVRFCGQYLRARGRSIRGKTAPWITYGRSKDHRPDLKQLLLVLTSTADGGIPMHFRCENGNTEDSTTHIDTWNALNVVTGGPGFLYVADCKLCTRESMDYIHERGGRFVTVIPRSRLEDSEFRRWIQTNEPDWELVWNRPNPRRKYGPRDRWWVFRYPIPSREGWPVTWVWSSLLALRQEHRRRERMAKAIEQLQDLKQKLQSPRSRLRKPSEIDLRVERILRDNHVVGYIRPERIVEEEARFRQRKPGRPGPDADYRKLTRYRFDVIWDIDERAIDYDRKSDGMYPLLTNDRSLTGAQVLAAHKAQPTLEKRFEQTKTVHEIAPVFLKNEDRVEALFFLYFIGLLVQALIEREIRRAMKREGIKTLPIYPEERSCERPTTEHILRLFAYCQREVLTQGDKLVQVFNVELSNLQRQVLALLGVPESAFNPRL